MPEKFNDEHSNPFLGERDLKFINSFQTEFIDHIVRQKIRYFVVDYNQTEIDDIYNESSVKVVSRVVELYARVALSNPEIVQGRFSSDRKQTIEVYAQRKHVFEDYNLTPRIGDFLEFDEKFFEITSMIDDLNTYGQPQFKMMILIKGVLARKTDLF